MTTPSKPSLETKPAPVQFIEFWRLVAVELGTSRLRVNRYAKTIHELVSKDSDARVYLRDAIKKSYKSSKCQNLCSPIYIEGVLDILGETAYQLQGDQADDLFDIELLEEIAWHISNRYTAHIESLNRVNGENNSSSDTPDWYRSTHRKSCQAQVLSFPNFKIRKANGRL